MDQSCKLCEISDKKNTQKILLTLVKSGFSFSVVLTTHESKHHKNSAS